MGMKWFAIDIGELKMTAQTNQQRSMLPEIRRPIPPAPIHPLAALATIVLDNVFGVVELVDPLAIIFTSLGLGALGAVTTALVQRYLAKDTWGASVAKGMVMGIIAGAPFQVTGTFIGIPLLAWAGLHEWVKLPNSKNNPEPIPEPDEVIDVEVRNVSYSEGWYPR
jgi:hypothetical protein